MKKLFKEKSTKIRIYMGTTQIIDPFSKETTTTLLNPLTIPAVVSEVLPEKLRWVLPGIEVSKTQQLIVEKKYLTLLRKSVKIQIKGEDYLGYKDNSGNFYLQDLGDEYIKIYTIKK